jgi:microcin C transport system substrate-binding protein
LLRSAKQVRPSFCEQKEAKRIYLMRLGFFVAGVLALPLQAFAQPRTDIITLSASPLPPLGFAHLPYANPNASKGGAFTTAAIGSFDNLNPFILRGTAPDNMFLVWQPLFKPSDTDSVTAYADLAQSADISPDGLMVTFHLNPRAKFSDGAQVTAADVIWTYHTLTTQGAPIYAALYAGITGAVAPGPQTAIFKLQKGAGRAAILNLAEMYILPAHFWRDKNFADPMLSFPIGSGPYQVAAVTRGDSLTLAHVANWWAADNPTDLGAYNFSTITERFFHTESVALQAFKAADLDARIEHSPAIWANSYNFGSAKAADISLEQPPLTLPSGINGLVMNTRRPIFADPRVRHALALAYDFDWTNRVLYHGEQTREQSFFSNSQMASSGLPTPAETKLLNPFRNQLPPMIFTTPYDLPSTAGNGENLANLRQAFALLNEAGWQIHNFQLTDKSRHPFTFEILLPGPEDAPAIIAYAASLKSLGISAAIRTIDPASYQRRLETYDFDMTLASIPATDYPDTEQAGYWSCAAAASPGGYNLAGICSPAIDAMIAAEIAAPDLAAKTTAIHALDRLLLAGWYFIPFGSTTHEDLAYWRDKVAKPAAPLQIGVDYTLWWAK